MDFKSCIKCNLLLPIQKFPPMKKRRGRQEKCRKCQREHQKKSRKKYEISVRVSRINIRAKNLGSRGILSAEDIVTLFEMYPTCLKCGTTEDLTIDHVTPLSRRGNNTLQNLQVLCRKCNSKKNNGGADYRTYNRPPLLLGST